MKYKAVIFDFDDTIVDYETWVRSKWNITCDLTCMILLKKYINDVLDDYGVFYTQTIQEALLRMRSRYLDEEAIYGLVNIYRLMQGADLIIPGFKSLYSWLKNQNIKVGILTNGHITSHFQRIYDIDQDLVDTTIFATKYEMKPNRKQYVKMMELLGIDEFDDILYIGDDIINDIYPAKMIYNMDTILIDADITKKTIEQKNQILSYKNEGYIDHVVGDHIQILNILKGE